MAKEFVCTECGCNPPMVEPFECPRCGSVHVRPLGAPESEAPQKAKEPGVRLQRDRKAVGAHCKSLGELLNRLPLEDLRILAEFEPICSAFRYLARRDLLKGLADARRSARQAAGLLRELKGVLGQPNVTAAEVLEAAEMQIAECDDTLKQLMEGA